MQTCVNALNRFSNWLRKPLPWGSKHAFVIVSPVMPTLSVAGLPTNVCGLIICTYKQLLVKLNLMPTCRPRIWNQTTEGPKVRHFLLCATARNPRATVAECLRQEWDWISSSAWWCFCDGSLFRSHPLLSTDPQLFKLWDTMTWRLRTLLDHTFISTNWATFSSH